MIRAYVDKNIKIFINTFIYLLIGLYIFTSHYVITYPVGGLGVVAVTLFSVILRWVIVSVRLVSLLCVRLHICI